MDDDIGFHEWFHNRLDLDCIDDDVDAAADALSRAVPFLTFRYQEDAAEEEEEEEEEDAAEEEWLEDEEVGEEGEEDGVA